MFCAAPPPHVLRCSLACRWARLRPRDRSPARTSPPGPRGARPSSLSPRPAFASLRRRSQGDARQVLPITEVSWGKAKAKSHSKSKSDEPMVRYRFAGELGRWAPAWGGETVCAGAATRLLSHHATSVCGEPSAPALDATCGTERVGRIRPAGGRPGRPAVLAEARRPNREPPPGARARRGVSHKTWPRSGTPSQATGEPERRGWGPAALPAT